MGEGSGQEKIGVGRKTVPFGKRRVYPSVCVCVCVCVCVSVLCVLAWCGLHGCWLFLCTCEHVPVCSLESELNSALAGCTGMCQPGFGPWGLMIIASLPSPLWVILHLRFRTWFTFVSESKFLEELLKLAALTWILTLRPAPFSRQPGAQAWATMALPPWPATLPHTLLLLPALLSSGTPLLIPWHVFMGSSPCLSPPCLHLQFGPTLGTRTGLSSSTYQAPASPW